MKKKVSIIVVLMLLPTVINAIALQFLPEQIPAHFNIEGVVDRFGSKYEVMILSSLTIVMGLIMMGFSKLVGKTEENTNSNKKVFYIATLMMLITFNILNIYFLVVAYSNVDNLYSMKFNVEQVMFMFLGLTLIILGNVMPKLRRNGLIGLRTSWSEKNDYTWKESQHFAGIAFIIAGFVMIIVASLTKLVVCSVLCMVILAVATIASVYNSYLVAKNEKSE